MKVFISHSQVDDKLASILKTTLEEAKEINEAFMFEIKKKYGTQIDKKITDEIDQSDYLVAIITNDAKESVSVNQELGYAQGKKTEKIPMIEEGAKTGILTHGSENVEFNDSNFKSKCVEVRKYILENGPKKKFTKEEELLIQKSAYYRQALEYTIHDFFDAVYYRLNISGDNQLALLNSGDPTIITPYLEKMKSFFNGNDDEIVSYISKIDFIMYRKLDMEIMHFKREVKNAERFPDSELPLRESDAIVKLKESLLNMIENDLDMGKYCKDIFNPTETFNFNNCSEVMKIKEYEHQVKQYLRLTLYDLEKILHNMIVLIEIFQEYKEKFGSIAFKNTYD